MVGLRHLWAAPVSFIGLILAGAARATGGRARAVTGVIEAEGGVLAWLLPRLGIGMTPSAMALGHVVVAVDAATLERTRSHERVHVAQAERWGIFLLPAYLAASLAIALRGGDPYLDNPFEREARARS